MTGPPLTMYEVSIESEHRHREVEFEAATANISSMSIAKLSSVAWAIKIKHFSRGTCPRRTAQYERSTAQSSK